MSGLLPAAAFSRTSPQLGLLVQDLRVVGQLRAFEHLADFDFRVAGHRFGQRLTHSIASSRDFTFHIQ
jgi:hypothetical protein